MVAYTEFKGTNSKLSRYSSTVHSLQELLMWWETLPQIDRSVVANVDYLVLTWEEQLLKEQQAVKPRRCCKRPPPQTESWNNRSRTRIGINMFLTQQPFYSMHLTLTLFVAANALSVAFKELAKME